MSIRLLSLMAVVLAALVHAVPAAADTAPRPLPYAQSWADTALISANDDWSSVPAIIGYRGDGLTAAAGVDPQTVVADGSATPVSVLANQKNPAALFAGGIAEFELDDPVVGLQPSSTADAPQLVLALDTSGYRAVTVGYMLRDLDRSSDDAVQPVALQYRVGSNGDFANVTAGFVADATAGPGSADSVTPVTAVLPAAAADRPLVQVRIVTTNAVGDDEWVGVDDLRVTGTDAVRPALTVAVAPRQKLGRALRYGLRPAVTVDEAVTLRAQTRISRRLARRLGLPAVVGRASEIVPEAGTTRMVVPFRAKARHRLVGLSSVRVNLRVRAVDAAGNARTVEKRILLVR